jgi:hypothetical protein
MLAMPAMLEVETLYMMTVTPNLPPKALRKYEVICDAIRVMGFQAGRGNAFHGTEIWLMKRNPAES